MNIRQRRGAILLILSGVVAFAVFVGLFSYTKSLGQQVKIYVLQEDATAFTPSAQLRLEVRTVPERYRPETRIDPDDPSALVAKITLSDLRRGTVLLDGMLQEEPKIGPDEREIAVLVDAEQSVARKVRPTDFVDIIATLPGDGEYLDRSVLVVQDVQVIKVDYEYQVDQAREREDGVYEEGKALPITFALSVADSQRLAYAESFAKEIRLALRAPNDHSVVDGGRSVTIADFLSTSGGSR